MLVKNLQALYYKFYLNDPNNINELYKIIESVTADDIVNFVNENFLNNHRYILNYIPEKKS